jgi:parallel beta-helix repeat protein
MDLNRKLAPLLIVILVGMLNVTFNVQRARASGTIYIRADGSVEGTDKIVSSDNITYTLTGNINDSIVVERDNIVVDGAGYTLEGNRTGIKLTSRSNVTIKNTEIRAFWDGIEVDYSLDITITENNITSCQASGIYLYESSWNNISGNDITNDFYGIYLWYSSNNSIYRNNITNNDYGIWIQTGSQDNSIYHNNFMDNSKQAFGGDYQINTWDDGYPSGGNYWSDYNGTDLYSGSYQNETGSDGIRDTKYVIDGNNADNYPLMGTFADFNATSEQHVQTICNSTISDFKFNGTAICFNVTGEKGTIGFCRICIPTALINGTYRVFVNGTEVTCNLLPCSNSTYSYLYFNYTHSTQEVVIILEFPSFLILPLFMIATLLAVIVYKRKKRN